MSTIFVSKHGPKEWKLAGFPNSAERYLVMTKLREYPNTVHGTLRKSHGVLFVESEDGTSDSFTEKVIAHALTIHSHEHNLPKRGDPHTAIISVSKRQVYVSGILNRFMETDAIVDGIMAGLKSYPWYTQRIHLSRMVHQEVTGMSISDIPVGEEGRVARVVGLQLHLHGVHTMTQASGHNRPADELPVLEDVICDLS